MLLDRLRKETATQRRALDSTTRFSRTCERDRERLKCFFRNLEPGTRLTFARMYDRPEGIDLIGPT